MMMKYLGKSWEWSGWPSLFSVCVIKEARSFMTHDSLVNVVSSNLYRFATQITVFHLTFKKSPSKTFLIAKKLKQKNRSSGWSYIFDQQKLLMFDANLSINWRYHSKFCLKSLWNFAKNISWVNRNQVTAASSPKKKHWALSTIDPLWIFFLWRIFCKKKVPKSKVRKHHLSSHGLV